MDDRRRDVNPKAFSTPLRLRAGPEAAQVVEVPKRACRVGGRGCREVYYGRKRKKGDTGLDRQVL